MGLLHNYRAFFLPIFLSFETDALYPFFCIEIFYSIEKHFDESVHGRYQAQQIQKIMDLKVVFRDLGESSGERINFIFA